MRWKKSSAPRNIPIFFGVLVEVGKKKKEKRVNFSKNKNECKYGHLSNTKL